jgi:hypothetical protein
MQTGLASKGVIQAIGGAVIGFLLLTCTPAFAAEALPVPQGEPILRVSGGIAVTNQDGKAVFDLALLQSLPQASLVTETPWTEGKVRFNGVRMRDLMDRLGAEGKAVVATATDEYRIEIPMADFSDYDVIIAYAQDGEPLRPDDKGPLWIVYPFSADPGLKNDTYFSRCVWQLSGLTVQ